jgi:hypothetical protein
MGCFPEPTPLPEKDFSVLRNDLENGELVLEHQVEDFKFITKYFTDYDTKHWRITDSKSLNMQAWIEGYPEGLIVLVEHVHIDIAIKSKNMSFDGWKQDTMDDSVHGGLQPGFWITKDYPYENVFAIEGYTETLIHGYAFCVYGYGGGSIEEKRFTEENLVDDGTEYYSNNGKVYANKVQVVYDLMIKNPGEELFHTRSIIDEFLIPVSKEAMGS